VQLPESGPTITFFQCPSCRRHYAQKPGQSLTYRWGHPISLALYYFSFRSEPECGHVQYAAREIIDGRSQEDIEVFLREIELELKEPSQQVKDILGTHASEISCREFLSSVISLTRSLLKKRNTLGTS
jgi:hypothetical protein